MTNGALTLPFAIIDQLVDAAYSQMYDSTIAQHKQAAESAIDKEEEVVSGPSTRGRGNAVEVIDDEFEMDLSIDTLFPALAAEAQLHYNGMGNFGEKSGLQGFLLAIAMAATAGDDDINLFVEHMMNKICCVISASKAKQEATEKTMPLKGKGKGKGRGKGKGAKKTPTYTVDGTWNEHIAGLGAVLLIHSEFNVSTISKYIRI